MHPSIHAALHTSTAYAAACSSCHLSPTQLQKVRGRTAFTNCKSNQKFWMHNLLSIFSASSPHQIKITLPPLTPGFLRSVVISGTHEASTQFAISLHYLSLVLPVSSIYLTSFYSCLVHPHGMLSPLHFSFTQTNSLDFFLLACHAFQKSALTSKDNSPWSSEGSGAGGQKTSPADCAL